ncbi:MAG TPA: hypothetical protein P5210_07335 [Draconibacterium sp.]|nr:hypothetical protein [Draconibacterium sp.]
METIKTFSAPHKALRKTMSGFLILAGQIDFGNTKAIEKLKKEGSEMFFLLTSHAETEDKIILSLLESKIPGASEHDKLDHLKIEKLQHELEIHLNLLSTSVTDIEAHEFYLRFASFFSLYLEHINEEETVTQKLIWEHLSVEEQLEIRAAIIAKMDPETYLIWMKHMFPAQNEKENLKMLGAIQNNMPAERFAKLLEILKLEMDRTDFTSLKFQLPTPVN